MNQSETAGTKLDHHMKGSLGRVEGETVETDTEMKNESALTANKKIYGSEMKISNGKSVIIYTFPSGTEG